MTATPTPTALARPHREPMPWDVLAGLRDLVASCAILRHRSRGEVRRIHTRYLDEACRALDAAEQVATLAAVNAAEAEDRAARERGLSGADAPKWMGGE